MGAFAYPLASRRWLISQVFTTAAVLFQTCGAAQTKTHEWYAKIIEWTVEHSCELVRMPVLSPEQRDDHEEHKHREVGLLTPALVASFCVTCMSLCLCPSVAGYFARLLAHLFTRAGA